MFSLHWFRHWDKVFWVVFVVMGIFVVAGEAIALISFEFFLVLGLFMVIIGAGKLAEEISKNRLVNYQDDLYRKIHQISQHLERTFNLADSYKNKTEFRLHKLDQRRKMIEINTEKKYRDLARKIIELENRVNRVSKIMIEREKSRFQPKGGNFAENVLSLVKQVPRGKVTTYSEIAKIAGKPKASKAIGKVIASNLHLKTVPFHRIVKSSGKVVGSDARKRTSLLRGEGVKIERGKIDLDKHMFSFVPKI
ncbi:MAG: methylated-DNA--[protein]-cysteine S-methyltransferase [Candidatus Aenigmatarchaeota archaeon]|nr:MAG: methylated-DNA--[protein]-cysteine S-methyltransferase [Candidatus Aenigmarchaeota archaeon]